MLKRLIEKLYPEYRNMRCKIDGLKAEIASREHAIAAAREDNKALRTEAEAHMAMRDFYQQELIGTGAERRLAGKLTPAGEAARDKGRKWLDSLARGEAKIVERLSGEGYSVVMIEDFKG